MRTPVIGERISVNGVEGKIVSLCGVGFVRFRPKFARSLETVDIDTIVFLDAEKLEGEIKKQFVQECVDGDLRNYIFKNQQISILNKLIEEFPNINFWKTFRPYKVKSLIWFQNAGKDDVKKEYRLFCLEFPPQKPIIEVSAEKLGTDSIIPKTAKTFLEL